MAMNRTRKVVLTVLGFAGMAAGLIVAGLVIWLYFTEISFDQVVGEDFDVKPEWTEFRPEPSLQTRRKVADLQLTIPNYRAERGGTLEIKLPDGRVVRPEIQIVDANGNVFDLEHSGHTFTGTEDSITFKPKGGPPNTTYSIVRIRSDVPFRCERIVWRESNPQ
jgi:hypothetical protein